MRNKSNEEINNGINLEFLKKYPKDLTSIFKNNITIYLDYSKVSKYIDLYSVRMAVDNKVICAKVTTKRISYKPRKSLEAGIHTVRVFFRSKNNDVVDVIWKFTIQDKSCNYRYYYGIPHAHTSYSSGEGLPQESFKYSKKQKLDYIIITDHTRKLKTDGKIGKDKKVRDFNRWDAANYEAKKFSQKNKSFLPMIGFEFSTKLFGHVNIYNTDKYIDKRMRNISVLNDWLLQNPTAIVCINHPNKKICELSYDDKLDYFINFVEVGNGAPPFKYCRYEEIYYKLLDNGWHIGAMNGQDNHKSNWGEEDNLTVVIAKSLNKKDFVEALINRRVYSTESRSLKMSFKANDCWMGSIIDCENKSKISFSIALEDKQNNIEKIEVITNCGEVVKKMSYKDRKKVKWNFDLVNIEEHTWYVLKVTQKGDKVSISSPIFTS